MRLIEKKFSDNFLIARCPAQRPIASASGKAGMDLVSIEVHQLEG
jgi:hypothetical protein